MKSEAETPEKYIEQLPEKWKEPVKALRNVILKNIPDGFSEEINYGMIGYVVPKSVYPKGYHVNASLPLPFLNIAAQKNHIALYHMGLYSDKELMTWFLKEYPKYSSSKPDMGKSCIRFKNPDNIPFELIGLLATKITTSEWIKRYEEAKIN